VLVLVLQHMAVSLTAISLVRDRVSGAIDLFRVAPIHPVEVLVGKYAAYCLLSAVVAVILLALTVFGLNVPMLGDRVTLAGALGLLIFASVGMGMLISTISDSERQAVQLTMLVLLASVFFSGFVLPLEDFQASARGLAYALPVTHGIRLTQDTMLRGETSADWQIWTLGGLGAAFFLVTAVTMHRVLARDTVKA
jgi:ABC-2 type transport system permease protein